MLQWLTDNFGLALGVIGGLTIALVYGLFYYLRFYIQSVANPDGKVERKIDEQTDHLDGRLDALSERIQEVDEKAKQRDKNIRDWAREEFADASAVSRLRSDLADMRSDVMGAMGQLQSQMTDLMNTLIQDS